MSEETQKLIDDLNFSIDHKRERIKKLETLVKMMAESLDKIEKEKTKVTDSDHQLRMKCLWMNIVAFNCLGAYRKAINNSQPDSKLNNNGN
jgi:tetrahydromethanopterin S-methyltransferase subunit B